MLSTPALLIISIPVALFLININHWYYLRSVIRRHDQYIDGIPSDVTTEVKRRSDVAADWLQANTLEIKRRVLNAGVRNPTRSYMEPAGYGYVGQQTMSALDNLLYQNEDVLTLARRAMETAKGQYLTRATQSLSPLYWLEIVIYLPRALVSAAGLATTSKLAEIALKISQLVYWAIVVGVAVQKYLKLI